MLDKLVALFGLLFEPDKFPALPTEDPIPKPFKALIFSFPGGKFYFFEGKSLVPMRKPPPSFPRSTGDEACFSICSTADLGTLTLLDMATTVDASSAALALAGLRGCTTSSLDCLRP